MAYPRRCPLCGADYHGSIRVPSPRPVVGDLPHVTLHAEPGGKPSHRRPGSPGLLLTLRCSVCRGEYAWDYFAGQEVAPGA